MEIFNKARLVACSILFVSSLIGSALFLSETTIGVAVAARPAQTLQYYVGERKYPCFKNPTQIFDNLYKDHGENIVSVQQPLDVSNAIQYITYSEKNRTLTVIETRDEMSEGGKWERIACILLMAKDVSWIAPGQLPPQPLPNT